MLEKIKNKWNALSIKKKIIAGVISAIIIVSIIF